MPWLYPIERNPETPFTESRIPLSDFYHHGDLIAVLTTQPLDRTLDYRAPEGGCHAGAFVEVPLGPRRVLGVVWGPGQGDFDLAKVRYATRVLDVAPMREDMQDFLTRAAEYTMTPLPAMLRLATRAPGLGDAPATRRIYRLGQGAPDRMTPARQKVLEVLRDYGGLAFTLRELAEMAGVSTGVVKGLAAQGAVLEEDSPRDMPFPTLDPAQPGKALNEDQAAAVVALRAAIARATGMPHHYSLTALLAAYLRAHPAGEPGHALQP